MSKKDRIIEGIFCTVLLILPFIHVNVGLNVADQGYNLYNFEAFPDMNTTWMISTLFANVLGKLLTFLPFGHYMLGMNIYCTLLLALVSVLIFMILKKDYSRYAVFAGLVLAICFSWAPKVTLYQYLSYYLFCAGGIVLVKGLEKQKRKLLFLAGAILALNLYVRFPNICQVALIVAVIYAAVLYKRAWKEALLDVLVCIAGYLAVALPVFIFIEIIWGSGSYMQMVQGLFSMTEKATSYTPFSMFMAMYNSYAANVKYFLCFVLEAALAVVVYGFLKKKWMKYVFCGLAAVGFLFILRVFWYYGMLNVEYTGYRSVYLWGVCFLFLSMCFLLYALVSKKLSKTQRLYALTGLVIIFVTPLGSNNALYSNFNNLYLLAPITIGTMAVLVKDWFLNGRKAEAKKHIWQFSAMPVLLVSSMLVSIVLVQTILFHGFFVFGNEGIIGKDKFTVRGSAKLSGILTTEEDAKTLSELVIYVQEQGLGGEGCIVWSHSPMVYYALDLECTIGHAWPMLDSYPYEDFVRDMWALESFPMVIYEARYYPDLLSGETELDSKTQVIVELLEQGNYTEVFRNDYYVICMPLGDGE